MILISAGLVLAAVVLLIAGFVLATPFLIMWSIVVSVLSALFLVIGAFLRRNELFPGGGQAAAPATPPKGLMPPAMLYNQTSPMAHQPQPRPQPHPQAPPQRTAPTPAPRRPAASGIAPDAIVLVIPGRKRYHRPGCRQLIGRDQEELTYEEAREEGFTPCTTCLPDAALGGRQLPPAADPEPVVAPGPALTESRAENSGETRDLRPPVTPPKPDTKASTPSPEPAAAHEEGAPGWFGRSTATPESQAKASAAPESPSPDSDDEQAEQQTSYLRPPPFALRAESAPAPGKPSSGKGASGGPAAGEPSDDETMTSPGELSRPAGGAPEQQAGQAGGKPGQPGVKPGQPVGKTGQPGVRPSGQPVSKSGQSSEDEAEKTGRVRIPAGKTGVKPGQTAATPEQPGGPGAKPEQAGGPGAKPGQAGGSGAKPGQAGGSGAKPEQAGGKPGQPGGKPVQAGGKPGQSSGARDDDSAGPATAPQPRVTVSGMPARPESSDGDAKPSQRPSGPVEEPSSGGETVVLHERPASSAESTAKPKGPLPTGAPGGSSGAKPGAVPGKAGSERPPAAGSERPPVAGAERRTATGSERSPSLQRPSVADAGSKAESSKTDEAADSKGPDGGKGERPRTVKVIIGTRRYHSTACPLIRGAGETGVETMTLPAAEAAGLTSCSVCQHERETVG